MAQVVKVRRATAADAVKIFKIGMSTGEFWVSSKIKFFTLDELKEFVGRKDCIFLVADVAGEIAGFVIAFAMTRQWIFIDNFYVKPVFRKHGVGSAIEKEIERIARKRKIDYVSFIVKPSNISTRKFFRKKDFKEATKFLWMEKFI
jgi:ribosomal protein S18 acetylase RimI-like enzyme